LREKVSATPTDEGSHGGDIILSFGLLPDRAFDPSSDPGSRRGHLLPQGEKDSHIT